MTKVFDTGITTDHDSGRLAISKTNGRANVYRAVDQKYYIVYLDEFSGDTSLYVAWGDEASFSTELLVTEALFGGLLKSNTTRPIYQACLDIDDVNDDLHICWVERDGTTSEIFHAVCTDPSDMQTIGNWTTWGSNEYQRVDSSDTSKYAQNPSLFVDTWNTEPIIVWEQENGQAPPEFETYINIGDGANFSIGTANALCLSTSGADADHGHRWPSLINCNEIGQEIFVAWVHIDTDPSNVFKVQCKRLKDGDDWGTFTDWDGPESGTNTPDDIARIGDADYGDTTTMTYWYDGGANVFVGAILDSEVITNWFHEAGVLFGAGDEWFNANGTKATGASGGALDVSVSLVNTNDFRTFRVDTVNACVFADTNYIADNYWPTGSWEGVTLDPDFEGVWNSEWLGGITQSTECELLFVEETPSSDKHIRIAHTDYNHQPTLSIVTPKIGIGEDEEQAINLTWTYSDVDNDLQDNWKVEVYDYGDWGTPVWTNTGARPDSTTTQQIPPDTLSTGNHYMWRAKVWDDNYGTEYGYNSESEWAPSTGTADFWTTLPPILDITEYNQYPETRWPRIAYSLQQNTEKNLAMGTAQYRVDAGSWLDMSEKSGVGSEGLSGLSTGTPAPDTHYFFWDAEIDKPGIYSTDIDVRMEGHVTGKDYNPTTGMIEELDGSLDTKVPTISLSLPADQDTVVSTIPTFEWNNAVDDSALWSSGAHLWELDRVATFDSGSLQQGDWTDLTEWEPSLPLDKGIKYYWRVRGADNFLNVGSSDTWEINIQGSNLTDYVKIVDNEKMYKLRNFTMKITENSASVLSSTIGEELEES